MSQAKKGKRFKYSLETLLKVRKIREKQEQDKFTEAEKKLVQAIEREKIAEDLVKSAYAELKALMSGETLLPDMNVIKMHKRHLEVQEENLKQEIKKREQAEREKEQQRKKLIQAIKERKIIEKDREKTKISWKKLMDKEESKFLDDLNSISAAKKINPDTLQE